MVPVSTFRLYLLRAGYLLLAAGMGSQVWPDILHHDGSRELMDGVVTAMLGSLTALSVLGLRYPLRMLPLLFFEMGWKAIWLTMVALPAWRTGTLDPATANIATQCLVVVVFPFLVPWRYAAATYLTQASEPWGRQAPSMRLTG